MTVANQATSGPSRQRRHQQTKREILDAAWVVAEEHGIAGLSFREVSRRVGMQAPSLYTYFQSKNALFDAMFAEGYRQLGEVADVWMDRVHGLDPQEALGVVTQEWIRFCQTSIARYQLMFTRAIPGWQPSPEAYSTSTQVYVKMTEELTRIGIAKPQDLDLYTAVVSGLAAQQLANDPTGDRWVKLAPVAARMVLDDIQRRNT